MRLQMSLGETISESLWSSRFSIVTGSHLWHQIDRPVRKRAAYARFRRWRLNPPTTTFTLRNEPRTLVFEGGDPFPTPPPPPPSKTSCVCSFSTVETQSTHHHLHPQKRAAYARFRRWRPFPTPPPPPPSETSRVRSFSRVETLFQHHHHLHLRNRAAYARFRRWRPLAYTTTSSTFRVVILFATTTMYTTLERKHKRLHSRWIFFLMYINNII